MNTVLASSSAVDNILQKKCGRKGPLRQIVHIEFPAQHTTIQQVPSKGNVIDSSPGATIDVATLDSKSWFHRGMILFP
jgi:hypothetical protein